MFTKTIIYKDMSFQLPSVKDRNEIIINNQKCQFNHKQLLFE